MREIQFREAIREAMSEEMRVDENIYLMGEEVAEYNGAYKVSQGMLDEFGAKRVIDSPISELGFTGIAVGASMNGLRPIIEYMTWNFAILAADQIINHAAKMLQMSGGQFNCPIVFRGGNGTAGQLAATHSQSFEQMYSHIPGLKVLTPANPYDAKGLLKAAIRDNDPVLFMESEKMYGDKGEVPEGIDFVIEIGKAHVQQEGTDCTVVSFGKSLKVAQAAADVMTKEGHSIEVINLRTIRPLDVDTIVKSVKKTKRLVIVEESFPYGSISTEITYNVQKHAFDYLDAPVRRVTQSDTPFPFSPVLLELATPGVAAAVRGIKEVMYL